MGFNIERIEPIIAPPEPRILLKAGPSKTHNFSPEVLLALANAAQMDHRGPWTKQLLKETSNGTFDLLGIPPELRDVEFQPGQDQQAEGYHVGYTNSGTDGMERAIRAICAEDGTLLVNTDEFSTVAGNEMDAMKRPRETMKFNRGEALTVDSPQFQEIVGRMERGELKTIYLTRNGTTTGTDQKDAIEALVKARNERNCDTVIVVDEVSAQWIGAERDGVVGDVIFTTGQKDMAVGPGTGVIVFNNRALRRAEVNDENGLDTGGKLGIGAIYGTNDKRMAKEGQTAQTPPLDLILRQNLVQRAALEGGAAGRIAVRQMQNAARTSLLAAVTSGELGDLGVRMLTQNPAIQSKTAHVLKMPNGVDAGAVVKGMQKAGVEISGGYGKFSKDEARVCVYSANDLAEVETAITAMQEQLKKLKS